MSELKGLKAKNRAILSKLTVANRWPLDKEVTAKVLGIDGKTAGAILINLAKSGWLQRIKRGLYMPLAIEAQEDQQLIDDPWVIANSIFSPCYIGGWDAISHWELTDQIFHSTYVFTSKPQKQRKQLIKNHVFMVQKVSNSYFVGLKTIWSKGTKIKISDPSRTIVDLFDNPDVYGGIPALTDVLKSYLRSEHKSLDSVLSYIKQVGNKTIYKRLGYLVENLAPQEKKFIAACLKQ
ncbi:MAG: hypothetical protein K2X53_02455, partial [Alphaproteobacteria bacterium]|nr:hypothetical protein [Alphaproteobacteria bacterium]